MYLMAEQVIVYAEHLGNITYNTEIKVGLYSVLL